MNLKAPKTSFLLWGWQNEQWARGVARSLTSPWRSPQASSFSSFSCPTSVLPGHPIHSLPARDRTVTPTLPLLYQNIPLITPSTPVHLLITASPSPPLQLRTTARAYLSTELCVMLTQLRLTLCSPMDCSPPGSSCMEFSRQEYWVGCHFLLQGIFLIQGLHLRLLPLLHWQTDSLPGPCHLGCGHHLVGLPQPPSLWPLSPTWALLNCQSNALHHKSEQSGLSAKTLYCFCITLGDNENQGPSPLTYAALTTLL